MREESVEAIVQAALRCLARKGSESLAMREIADEAGVSKSLLHYHFKTKEDLLLAVIDRFFSDMVGRIEAVTASLAARAGGGADALLGSLDAIRRELRAAGGMQATVLRLAALGTTDASIGARLREFRDRLRGLAVEGLRRALAGRPPPPLPLEDMAELLLATVIGLEASRLFAGDPSSLDGAFEVLKLLFVTIGIGG